MIRKCFVIMYFHLLYIICFVYILYTFNFSSKFTMYINMCKNLINQPKGRGINVLPFQERKKLMEFSNKS